MENIARRGAEFGDVFQMETDFAKKVEAEFNRMISARLPMEAAA